MKQDAMCWYKGAMDELRDLWGRCRTTVLFLAVAVMSLVSVIWLSYQFWRLLWGDAPIWPTSPTGAVDLRVLHALERRWFTGEPVYFGKSGGLYPPASYLILWPLLGWLPVTPARWIWAASSLLALGLLVWLMLLETGADRTEEQVFLALIPLAMYSTGATIGNGQLTVHVLTVLVIGLLRIARRRDSRRADLLGTLMLVFALVKPSVSVPLLWVVLSVPRAVCSLLLVAAAHGGLSLYAASFQRSGLVTLTRRWLQYSATRAAGSGQLNLHAWLHSLGLGQQILLGSLLVLVVLGLWTYRHRAVDTWLLMGVTALGARVWTYHAWYDDLLILLPMIALFRVAKRGPAADGSDVIAGALLALTLVTTLAPGGLYLLPPPWKGLYLAAQLAVWLAVLVFLLDRARRERTTLMNAVDRPPGT